MPVVFGRVNEMTVSSLEHNVHASVTGLSRREMLGVGGALLFGGSIATAMRYWTRNESGHRADVFIGKTNTYDARIADLLMEGLAAIGIGRQQIRGKRILLKPNLVETAPGQPHINTHSAMVVAAAEAFRRLDAGQVIVAEGQGHRRDSLLVLEESGMGRELDETNLSFVDLNHDEFAPVSNAGLKTSLRELYLPRTLLDADWVVSMPKLKTHHWTGVTCAMKNMFGVMPGIVYGWPKNVLHHEGIFESIYDIAATVKPSLAIVDGIIGMEGDGPIMGTPKPTGCIIVGRNAPSVDATATRIMGLNPYGIGYLTAASGKLGPIHEHNIAQRGESIESVKTRFDVLDLPHLKNVTVV